MKIDNVSRFKDAPWFPRNTIYIIIGGAGGISSWTALFLARMSVNMLDITVYDNDIIEEHNLGGQFYKINQIGLHKVDAIALNIYDYTYSHMRKKIELYTDKSMNAPIMIAGFDNMKARKVMFENWKKGREHFKEDIVKPLFIDARLLAEQIQIICITKEEQFEKYETEYLFDDKDVPDAPCTFRQVSFSAGIIGGLITSFFANHLANCYTNTTSRPLPFFYEHYLQLSLINQIFI